MHITLETDYAIRIVDCIASAGERMGAQAIADKTGVTLRFSLKILRKLVQGGIVNSFKGSQGGYEFAKTRDQVSINDILETIEGPYMFSRCLSGDYICSRNEGGGNCKYHLFFNEISDKVREELKAATMDKFV